MTRSGEPARGLLSRLPHAVRMDLATADIASSRTPWSCSMTMTRSVSADECGRRSSGLVARVRRRSIFTAEHPRSGLRRCGRRAGGVASSAPSTSGSGDHFTRAADRHQLHLARVAGSNRTAVPDAMFKRMPYAAARSKAGSDCLEKWKWEPPVRGDLRCWRPRVAASVARR